MPFRQLIPWEREKEMKIEELVSAERLSALLNERDEFWNGSAGTRYAAAKIMRRVALEAALRAFELAAEDLDEVADGLDAIKAEKPRADELHMWANHFRRKATLMGWRTMRGNRDEF